jgi:hypothetical protein
MTSKTVFNWTDEDHHLVRGIGEVRNLTTGLSQHFFDPEILEAWNTATNRLLNGGGWEAEDIDRFERLAISLVQTSRRYYMTEHPNEPGWFQAFSESILANLRFVERVVYEVCVAFRNHTIAP